MSTTVAKILTESLKGKEVYVYEETFFINNKKLHVNYFLHKRQHFDYGETVSAESKKVVGKIKEVTALSETYEADALEFHLDVDGVGIKITTYSLTETIELKK
jgi:hypothetical protein